MTVWLENLLVAIGGGTVVLVGCFTVLKGLFVKFFETGIIEERIFETSKALLDEFLAPWYSDTFHDPYNLLFRGESSDLFQVIPSALREHM